jgi:hypothetical protein
MSQLRNFLRQEYLISSEHFNYINILYTEHKIFSKEKKKHMDTKAKQNQHATFFFFSFLFFFFHFSNFFFSYYQTTFFIFLSQ